MRKSSHGETLSLHPHQQEKYRKVFFVAERGGRRPLIVGAERSRNACISISEATPYEKVEPRRDALSPPAPARKIP